MAITQTITPPPEAPSRDDPSTFIPRADAWVAWQEGQAAEQNTWAEQVNETETSISAAKDSAETAVTNCEAETAKCEAETAKCENFSTAAAASANATIYDASTTYDAGDVVLDPANSYNAYTSQAGSNTGHTPSSDDGTWWAATVGIDNLVEDTTPQLGGDLNGNGHKQYNTILKSNVIGQVSINQTLDCAAYNQFSLEPTADITLNFTNVVAGTIVSLRLTGGGDHTLTWQVGGATTNWKWAGGAEPAWSVATGIDVMVVIGNGVDSCDAGLSLGGVA